MSNSILNMYVAFMLVASHIYIVKKFLKYVYI